MNLLSRQREFRDYLRDAPNSVAGQVKGDADGRLAVYHNAFRARLGDCLRDAYPKSWSYLGDDHFAAAVQAHRIDCEPHSWTLDAYGAGFDQTLSRMFPGDAEVTELAWLEWALRRAFDGADAVPLPLQELGGIDWDSSSPLLHPTTQMREMATNGAAIWAAIDSDEMPPAAQSLPEPTLLLVWRKGLVPQYRSTTDYERSALLGLSKGFAFGAICDDIFAGLDSEQAIRIAGALFSGWLRDGLIVGASPAKAR